MKSPLYDRIRRFTNLTIFALVASFAAAAAAVIWQETKISLRKQHILTFHGPALQSVAVAARQLSVGELDMLNQLLKLGPNSGSHGSHAAVDLQPTTQVQLQGHLYVVGKAFEAISDVHKQDSGDYHFSASIAKIGRELTDLRKHAGTISPVNEAEVVAQSIEKIRAAALSLRQLERLHIIARADDERQIERATVVRNYVVIPFAVVVLACGFLVLRYLARQTRVVLTQLERSDLALRDLNQTLEDRVEQRSLELREAQDAVLRNERLAAIGQLTATVSHELRNPLGALQSAVSSLDSLVGNEDRLVRRSVSLAERSINRVNNIIRDLLDFSRNPALHLVPTEIDDWLAHELEDYQLPKGVELETRLKSGAVVDLDAERFRRALINLLDNACEAMLSGETDGDHPHLAVSSSRPSESVEIAITDNGPGIEPQHFRKVFEPLYSTKSIGVGLGLAIVKQIVEHHNGSVDLVAGEARGTTAVVRLPAV